MKCPVIISSRGEVKKLDYLLILSSLGSGYNYAMQVGMPNNPFPGQLIMLVDHRTYEFVTMVYTGSQWNVI